MATTLRGFLLDIHTILIVLLLWLLLVALKLGGTLSDSWPVIFLPAFLHDLFIFFLILRWARRPCSSLEDEEGSFFGNLFYTIYFAFVFLSKFLFELLLSLRLEGMIGGSYLDILAPLYILVFLGIIKLFVEMYKSEPI